MNIKISKEKISKNWILFALLTGWALFTFFSIFTIPASVLLSGFTIFSILSRLLMLTIIGYAFYHFFTDYKIEARIYENWLLFFGYAIVLGYVFFMLPQVVLDFRAGWNANSSFFFTFVVILTSMWPAAIWIYLSLNGTRLRSNAYTQKTLKKRIEIKKDKAKTKQAHLAAKKKRSPLANFWVEWVEQLFGAILWVLIINHFLFQLYVVPSESMVPTFLTKDRVLVGKTLFAPNIPLTNFKLPRVLDPEIGDVVVFTNPKVMDRSNSLSYNNEFTRVFKNFVYICTLTLVDIDKKANGEPKEQMLVKRLVAEPGERVLMVADKLYKSQGDGNWILMSELDGQEEYGQVELYGVQNPNQVHQRETPGYRELLEGAESIAYSMTENELEINLENELIKLQNNQEELMQLLYQWSNYINDNQNSIDTITTKQAEYFNNIYRGYRNAQAPSPSERRLNTQNFDNYLTSEYYKIALYNEITKILNLLQVNNLNHEDINVYISESQNPYEEFASRLNSVYKYYRLKMINDIFENGLENYVNSVNSDFEIVKLNIYLDGILGLSLFAKMNMPPFPENGTIAEDEYMVMGDNRYNSLDGRFYSEMNTKELVDKYESSPFGAIIAAEWDPYTIPKDLIHGNVNVIIHPFSRFRIFR